MPGRKTWAFACSSALLSRVSAEAPRAGTQLSRDYSLRFWGSLQLCPRACRISLCVGSVALVFLTASSQPSSFCVYFQAVRFFPPFFKYNSFNQAESGLCIQLSYHRLNKGMHSTGVVWGWLVPVLIAIAKRQHMAQILVGSTSTFASFNFK